MTGDCGCGLGYICIGVGLAAVLVQLHDLQAGVTGGSELLIHVLFL